MIVNLVYVVTAPFVASARLTSEWKLGHGFCSFLNYWLFVCATCMVWTLAFISIDRYLNISLGVSTLKRLRGWHIFLMCLSLWAISILGFLPIALYSAVLEVPYEDKLIKVCTLIWPEGDANSQSAIFHGAMILVNFIIPGAIISFCYIRIFMTFRKSRRAVESFNHQQGAKQARPKVSTQTRSLLKTLIGLVVAFIAFWSPIVIVLFLIEKDNQEKTYKLPSAALVWALIAAYSNGIANACLYGMTTRRNKTGGEETVAKATSRVDKAVDTHDTVVTTTAPSDKGPDTQGAIGAANGTAA